MNGSCTSMKGILVNLHYHGRNPTILMQAIIFQFPYHAKNYDERMALCKLFDKTLSHHYHKAKQIIIQIVCFHQCDNYPFI